MKTNNEKATYETDSCFEKIKLRTHNVCNRPSYHTVCYKPIIKRSLLTHDDYLNMLSTPKGYKWTGMISYLKKMNMNYNVDKSKINNNQWKRSNLPKSYKQGNEENRKRRTKENKIYDLKKQENIYRQKINNENNDKIIRNIKYYKQKQTRFSDTSNEYSMDEHELDKYYKSKKLHISHQKHNLTTSNDVDKITIRNKINTNRVEDKFKEIKKKREADYVFQKKKQLWLQARKHKKKREEKDNKLNFFSQEKQKKKNEELKNEMKKKINTMQNQNLKEEIKKQQKQNEQNKDNTSIQNNEDNSIERLKEIEQREVDIALKKKKQLWLQAENQQKRKEEKENKYNTFLQMKRKKHEELKKKMEQKIKVKTVQKHKLEEERKKQKDKKENEEMTKKKIMTEKINVEEQLRLIKENEKNHRLEALKLEAKKIIEEEEAWRNRINREFAEKMRYKINSNNQAFSIIPYMVNNEDEHLVGKTGKKRFIQYIKNLLRKKIEKDQVFDPGNLMKQIIKKELEIARTRQIKLRNRLETYNESFDKNKKTQIVNVKSKKEKQNLTKSIVFKSYGQNNTFSSQILCNQDQIKSKEHCLQKQHRNISRYKIPIAHCYSNISFNTIVSHWKDEVDDMVSNMQKRRKNFVRKAMANNKREHQI